jgi:hypothetical protein
VTTTAPGPTPSPTTTGSVPPTDTFQQIEDAKAKLLSANTYWRIPTSVAVGSGFSVGLGIQSAPVSSQINPNISGLPGTTQNGPVIRVSPHSTATLAAAPNADVEPRDAQNQSTSSDIDMAFQWNVTPKSVGDLVLTAYVAVHLDGVPAPNDVITIPITAHIQVNDTTQSWFDNVLDYGGKIAGIVSALGLGTAAAYFRKNIAAFFRRIRGAKQQPDVKGNASATPSEVPSTRDDTPD